MRLHPLTFRHAKPTPLMRHERTIGRCPTRRDDGFRVACSVLVQGEPQHVCPRSVASGKMPGDPQCSQCHRAHHVRSGSVRVWQPARREEASWSCRHTYRSEPSLHRRVARLHRPRSQLVPGKSRVKMLAMNSRSISRRLFFLKNSASRRRLASVGEPSPVHTKASRASLAT
jgi:hypothetical protein